MVPEEIAESLRRAVWSDFDGDELEECVALVEVANPNSVHLLHFERSEAGSWSVQDTVSVPWELLPFDDRLQLGDLDHDNDVDVAVTTGVWDAEPMTTYVTNSNGELVASTCLDYCPAGVVGNIDGDSSFELISQSPCEQTGVTAQIYSISDSLTTSLEYWLTQINGQMIGSVRTTQGEFPAGWSSVHCPPVLWMPPYMSSTLRMWDGGAWRNTVALEGTMWHASLADIDGDGRNDLLRGYSYIDFNWVHHEGMQVWMNEGVWPDDRFTQLVSVDLITALHDYAHSSPRPQLGDVNGDGMAEFIAIQVDSFPMPAIRLTIFRIFQLQPQEVFVQATDLMSGLPDTVSSFICPDLDGDGAVELLATVDGDQHLYFFRNGLWVEYEGILPEEMGAVQGFADWNGDGANDLFTNAGVWLNLTPSHARDEQAVVPREFEMNVYPNPFNPSATLQFQLERESLVKARVFDLTGREVAMLANESYAAGEHQLEINGSGWASGVYFARVETEFGNVTKKVLLIR